MGKSLTAVFDGEMLRPDHPADLEPDTRYRIVVEEAIPEAADPWDVMESLIGSIDAPEDWSVEHNHYLYGTPKRYPEAGE